MTLLLTAEEEQGLSVCVCVCVPPHPKTKLPLKDHSSGFAFFSHFANHGAVF